MQIAVLFFIKVYNKIIIFCKKWNSSKHKFKHALNIEFVYLLLYFISLDSSFFLFSSFLPKVWLIFKIDLFRIRGIYTDIQREIKRIKF